MPDMETTDTDYTKEKLQEPNSMPDKAGPNSSNTKKELTGAGKALASGVAKSMAKSNPTEKENAIADKASSEQAPMEPTPKPGALQGATLGSFKKGGTVPQTGIYKLHEGEEVVPAGKRMSLHRHAFNMRKGVTKEK